MRSGILKSLFAFLFILEFLLAGSHLIAAFQVQSLDYLSQYELKKTNLFSDSHNEDVNAFDLTSTVNSVTESLFKKTKPHLNSISVLYSYKSSFLPEISNYGLLEAADKELLTKILFPFHSFI